MTPNLMTTLQQETRSAILAYNMNRAQLVETAQREGGADAVAKLEEEFTALCNADFELTRAQLNENHPHYQTLMSEAGACADLLKDSIVEIQTLAEILDNMAKVVTLIGRILLVLAAA